MRQAQTLAKWLGDQLFETTVKRFPIRPVVLLPGWFVEVHLKGSSEVWVLNLEMLNTAIERDPVVLKREDDALASSRIVSEMQKL